MTTTDKALLKSFADWLREQNFTCDVTSNDEWIERYEGWVKSEQETILLTGPDDFYQTDVSVTSCCKIGPITSENYCPNCGKKIVKP